MGARSSAWWLLLGMACSSSDDRPVSPVEAMPSYLPPPPPGACEAPPHASPSLCGPLTLSRLSNVFSYDATLQRGFSPHDALPGDSTSARMSGGESAVYAGILAVPASGRYRFRVEDAKLAWFYFDDPRLVANHPTPSAARRDE